MSRENWEIVPMVVVLATCLLTVAINGVSWDETRANWDETRANPRVRGSCGDLEIRGYRVKIEVVNGNVPCRVARRVMKDQLGPHADPDRDPLLTGLWGCGTSGGRGIFQCKKTRGGQATIRAQLSY